MTVALTRSRVQASCYLMALDRTAFRPDSKGRMLFSNSECGKRIGCSRMRELLWTSVLPQNIFMLFGEQSTEGPVSNSTDCFWHKTGNQKKKRLECNVVVSSNVITLLEHGNRRD